MNDQLQVLTVAVRETKRPISQAVIGYRIVAVRPNKAQWNCRTRQFQTSFMACHRVAESGDYSHEYQAYEAIRRFVEGLGNVKLVS